MKTLIIAVFGAAIATTAVAQPAPSGSGRDTSDRRQSYERRGGYDDDRTGPGPGDMRRREMFEEHHPWMFGGQGEDRGAHFRFRRGDARIDIRCGDHESTSVCVEAAIRLMDKVMSMRPGEGTRTQSGSPTSPGSVTPP